jgi:hypothetical protein
MKKVDLVTETIQKEIENEEYELCHELTKLHPTIKAPLSN